MKTANKKFLPYIAIVAATLSVFGLFIGLLDKPTPPSTPTNKPDAVSTGVSIFSWVVEESTGAVESTGSIKLENENVPSILASKMAEEFAKADIVFYDGRKSKSKASDVRKWFKLHYGIELPGTDAVGTYDKTFATSRWDKVGMEVVKKWLPGIYTDTVSVPYRTTGIIVGENWQDVLPKLFREGVTNTSSFSLSWSSVK